MSLSLSSLFSFPKVFLYLPLCTIIANLWNVPVNVTPEPDNYESSSSVGVENPKFMDIFYGVGHSIHAQNVPTGSFGFGLNT